MNMVCCGAVTTLSCGVAVFDGNLETHTLLPTATEVSDVCMTDQGLVTVSRGPNGEICLWDIRALQAMTKLQCKTDFTCAKSSGYTLFVASSAGLNTMDLRALDYGPMQTYPMKGVGIRLDTTSRGMLCLLDTDNVWTLGSDGLAAAPEGDHDFVDMCCVGLSAILCGGKRLTWYHTSNQ